MSGKTVLGYWDCPLCQSKAISGLVRDCPNCGSPRGDKVKFYMIDKKNYLDAETAARVGDKADWLCEFCKSLNNSKVSSCPSCGSNKGISKRNYFGAANDKVPYWGDVVLADDERESSRTEKYYIKAYNLDEELGTYTVDYSDWKILEPNEVIFVKVYLGNYIKIVKENNE